MSTHKHTAPELSPCRSEDEDGKLLLKKLAIVETFWASSILKSPVNAQSPAWKYELGANEGESEVNNDDHDMQWLIMEKKGTENAVPF
jgi:hypothetical protein